MHYPRIRIAMPMALALTAVLAGCGDEPTSHIAGAINADLRHVQPSFNEGCGFDGRQLRDPSTGSEQSPGASGLVSMNGVPGRLQEVIVYGTPLQRPGRGYGSLDSYGGITRTFIYDRYALGECSYPSGNTFTVIGPVDDDTLDVPIEAPDGISQDLWSSLPPAVKKQLREAAWYLADHYVPNDVPGYGELVKDARRGLFFQVLANGYRRAQDLTPGRRRETEMFEAYTRRNRYGLTRNETLRADALLMGCMTVQSFRELRSFTGEQAETWATRVITAWAADATRDYTMRFLEPQLSRLGAIGAQLGREGDSCGSAARYHFENRPTELYDPTPNGGGGGDNSNLF